MDAKVKVEGKRNQSFDIREANLGFRSTNYTFGIDLYRRIGL